MKKSFLRVNQPVYRVKLPSGLELSYKPFLVRHEKALLTASEISKDSGEQKHVIETLRNVIQECLDVQGQEDVNVDELPIFDIEMLFLHLRSRSIGEEINLKLICPDDNETQVDYTLSIDQIKTKTFPEHTNVIDLQNYKFYMRYPGLKSFVKFNFLRQNEYDDILELLSDCVDKIVDTETEEAIDRRDINSEEVKEFFESLPRKEFEKINKFFETMPKIYHEARVTNPKTKVKSKIELQGLSDFLS